MIILVGPSASGKTQIGYSLKKIYGLEKVVTYTTRRMRSGEVNGIDYHFITKDEFLRLEKENFFFEYVCYNENYYGTAINSLNDNSYLILEPNGMKRYLSSKLDLTIFYLDCSEEVRFKRMIMRHDGALNAQKRIEIDRQIFNDEVKLHANYLVDVSQKSVDEIAKEIYCLCQK